MATTSSQMATLWARERGYVDGRACKAACKRADGLAGGRAGSWAVLVRLAKLVEEAELSGAGEGGHLAANPERPVDT